MEPTVYSVFLCVSTISFSRTRPAVPFCFLLSAFCFLLLEEQERDFVARETCGVRRMARAHGDVTERLVANLLFQLRRNFTETPRLESNHRCRPQTAHSCV